MNLRAWWTAAAVIALPLLHACGGSSEDSGNGAVRLVNASDAATSLDFYSSDTQLATGINSGTAGSYVSLGAASYTFKLKQTGSSTTANSSDRSVAESVSYTLLAYTTGEALKSAFLEESEAAPTSGTAKLRVFNTSTEAGSVDVYVTATDAALSASTATNTALAGERIGSYSEFGKGSWRIRVTGTGDKTDLRLDIPAITLADQQIATLVLTSTPGGVLVHGLLLNQKGTLDPYRNTSARMRLVASAASRATVSAVANGTTLSSGLLSPAVGNYTLVNAGDLTLDVKVDGSSVVATGTSLVAGSDTTLLVTGSAGAAQVTLIADDNRPALSSSNTKLRLVHGVSGLASNITLTADYSAVASDVLPASASTPSSMAASTTFRLEATSPAVTGSLYLATDVTLQASRVYTLFMLGDSTAPLGVLRRDR